MFNFFKKSRDERFKEFFDELFITNVERIVNETVDEMIKAIHKTVEDTFEEDSK